MVALLMFAWLASTPPSPEVTITLDRASYAPGDTARVTVACVDGGGVIFAFACDALVDARCEQDWINVYTPDCTNVRPIATRLAAGESVEKPFVIGGFATECDTLRLRLRYQDAAGQSREVPSEPFVLTPR
jgi:uncharacterized protein YfaS (alpha-2-macroglobulin family)